MRKGTLKVKIDIEILKKLRSQTGAGIMDAKQALEEMGGDIVKAAEALRKKGQASAAKRAGREAKQGIISSYVHTGGRIGAMVELNCETDFVARTPEFAQMARDLAMQVAAMAPRYLSRERVPVAEADGADNGDILLEQSFIKDPSVKIADMVNDLGAKTKENIIVGRFERFALLE